MASIEAYDVVAAPISGVHLLDKNSNLFNVVEIAESKLGMIETSRPGYSQTAQRYLRAGDRGVAIISKGKIQAMGWVHLNVESRVVRVKGYFPLQPGHAYLHADWTAVESRGSGLQRILIDSRARLIGESHPDTKLFANMRRDNVASLINYQRMGFSEVATLRVCRVWKYIFSRMSTKECSQ